MSMKIIYRRRPEYTCAACRHFEALPSGDGRGVCVRNAPPALAGDGTNDVFTPVWPVVAGNGYCGEFSSIGNCHLFERVLEAAGEPVLGGGAA